MCFGTSRDIAKLRMKKEYTLSVSAMRMFECTAVSQNYTLFSMELFAFLFVYSLLLLCHLKSCLPHFSEFELAHGSFSWMWLFFRWQNGKNSVSISTDTKSTIDKIQEISVRQMGGHKFIGTRCDKNFVYGIISKLNAIWIIIIIISTVSSSRRLYHEKWKKRTTYEYGEIWVFRGLIAALRICIM